MECGYLMTLPTEDGAPSSWPVRGEDLREDEESDVAVRPVAGVSGEGSEVGVLHRALCQLVVKTVLQLCNNVTVSITPLNWVQPGPLW